METLRKKYHVLGNKLHTASLTAGFIQEAAEQLKNDPNNLELLDKIIKNASRIEQDIRDVDREIAELKNIVYRSIDPDIDFEKVIKNIKEENRRIKIFILDDEEIITEQLKRKYEENGYIVESALTAEKGIEKINQFEPNIVILDLHLPGKMSGLDVLKYIRNEMKWIQVLMITREDDENVLNKSKELGVEAILIKPTTLNDINAKLSGMIQRLKR